MDKKWTVYGPIILLVIFLIALMYGNGNEAEKPLQVMVNYSAEKSFQPDLAVINLGVQTIDTDLNKAFTENNFKMERVTKNLEGIEGIEINTLNYQIYPRIQSEDEKQVQYFYVTNQIEVKTDNLKDLGEIINLVISSGANQVLSVNFTLKEFETARKDVTSAALAGLKDKINFLVEKLGKEKGVIENLNINDQNIERTPLQISGLGTMKEGIPPISPQILKIRVYLNARVNIY